MRRSARAATGGSGAEGAKGGAGEAPVTLVLDDGTEYPIVGAMALPRLPVAQYPSVAPPTVSIYASYLRELPLSRSARRGGQGRPAVRPYRAGGGGARRAALARELPPCPTTAPARRAAAESDRSAHDRFQHRRMFVVARLQQV
ncbi:hypothetical protein BE08_45720 [Sorangium cellulosum]|uniref:Uncharacterized protein n=1 Tax=Sorangium cellulosum TaxID=56 RepID=A0A150PP61_SORCE|nr:hypothetical protein BE08_45720 [Sorangium cellulosum]